MILLSVIFICITNVVMAIFVDVDDDNDVVVVDDAIAVHIAAAAASHSIFA